MHYPCDLDPGYSRFFQRHFGLVLGELTDTDDDFGIEKTHHVAQVLAAEAVEGLPFDDRKLWRGDVLGVVVHEDERTDIVDKTIAEEVVGLPAILLKEPPEPTATDLQDIKKHFPFTSSSKYSFLLFCWRRSRQTTKMDGDK